LSFRRTGVPAQVRKRVAESSFSCRRGKRGLKPAVKEDLSGLGIKGIRHPASAYRRRNSGRTAEGELRNVFTLAQCKTPPVVACQCAHLRHKPPFLPPPPAYGGGREGRYSQGPAVPEVPQFRPSALTAVFPGQVESCTTPPLKWAACGQSLHQTRPGRPASVNVSQRAQRVLGSRHVPI
jgi:hypothetical protein